MTLLDYEFEDLVEEAVRRNAIVYDKDSNNISEKLIYLMNDLTQDRLETVYIPTDVFPEFDVWGRSSYGKQIGAYLNVQYVKDRRLNFEEIKAVIKRHNISMPMKYQLVIGVFGDKAILGAV